MAGDRESGRGRPLRGGGGGGSNGGTLVHVAATVEQAGSYAVVRGLRKGQNLRPGGTSVGSCEKKRDKRARGRERDSDRQEIARVQPRSDGGGAVVQ